MARDLSAGESKVFYRLLQTVRTKAYRNVIRNQYFEAKRALHNIGPSIPEEMRDFATILGWANKAVKVPAARIRPHGFTADSPLSLLDDLDLIARDSKLDLFEGMAIEDMLQASCSFIFTTPGGPGEQDVIVSVRNAQEATAERDRRTDRVNAALEVLSRKETILYLPGVALTVESGRNGWQVTEEVSGVEGHVPCVPYVWGRSTSRPFGYSRISRPLMGMIDNGIRTMLRQEANAEWYSAPRMAMYGAKIEHFTDGAGERVKPWSREIGAMFGVPDFFNEETGVMDRAKIEQFAQASFQPHSDQMRTIGMLVSGETSIPVGYLGIIHDNPSSADAMRAAETDLMATVIGPELPKLEASRWELAKNLLIAQHGEWSDAMAADVRKIHPHVIDGATNTPSSRSDFSQKFAATYPEFATSKPVLAGWGFADSDIAAMESHAMRARAGSAIDQILGNGAGEGNEELEAAQVLKAKADALGVLRRAGVERNAAALAAGLTDLTFIEGEPITIKTKDE